MRQHKKKMMKNIDMDKLKKEIKEVLDAVYSAGESKAQGCNPYHWHGEEDEMFIRQIMDIMRAIKI